MHPGHYDEDLIKEIRMNKNMFNGKIFILTSNFTSSSAVLFSEMFSDNKLATIVGEVPGNSPTHYGYVKGGFSAPNSKLEIKTSSARFYRFDETKDPERLTPDAQVPAE